MRQVAFVRPKVHESSAVTLLAKCRARGGLWRGGVAAAENTHVISTKGAVIEVAICPRPIVIVVVPVIESLARMLVPAVGIPADAREFPRALASTVPFLQVIFYGESAAIVMVQPRIRSQNMTGCA